MSFQPGYVALPLRKGLIEMSHLQFNNGTNSTIHIKASNEGHDLVGLDMKQVGPGRFIVVVDELARVRVWKTPYAPE